MIEIFKALYLAIAYRFRGGGFIYTGSDSLVRSVWGASLSLSYIISHAYLSGILDLPRIVYAAGIIPMAFASLAWVPHGFCMNMGSGVHPWPLQGKTFWSGYWPGFWLPYDLSQAEYDAKPYIFKAALDFFGMVSVGIVRGIAVFAPWGAYSTYAGQFGGLYAALAAIGTKGLGSGLAYLIGDHFPLNLSESLSAQTPNNDNTCWGEFFEGIAWNAAIMVFCLMGA